MHTPIRVPAIPARRTALATALCGLALIGATQQAGAATVGACTGVSLPPSVLTNTLAPALTPLGSTLDSVLGLLLQPLGVAANLQSNLDSIAAGDPITLDVLDINGNAVNVLNDPTCDLQASSYAMDANHRAGLSMGGNRITGLGDEGRVATAGEIDSIAVGNDATTENTTAGAGNVAIGNRAAVTGATTINSVAIGQDSVATRDNEFSIGNASLGLTRTLTNVANGAVAKGSTEAITGDQFDLGVQYDPNEDVNGVRLKNSITLAGATSTDGGVTGGTRITNLARGVSSATSTDAINGSQFFELESGQTGLVRQVGGAPGNGDITIGAQTGGTVVNIAGTGGNRRLTGLAAGNIAAGSTDAVTGDQVFNLDTRVTNIENKVDSNLGNVVQYDDATKNSLTLGGANGTQIKNVADGVDDTDAVNVRQLQIAVANGVAQSTKYFKANSTAADAVASGTDATAVGPRSTASGTNSLALGMDSKATALDSLAAGTNSLASGEGAIALGRNTQSTGLNTIAIGTGARATNSVAVGAGAQASLGGTAIGDNSQAIQFSRSVALGDGAVAGRAGMNGATERFSNAAVASTAGAVSVGNTGDERQITNVAGGTADTDAVNVRQLGAVDSRIDSLARSFSENRDETRAGISAAMAMATMPQATLPGKSMIAAGTSYYEGQSALAIGVSSLSDNGRWVIKGQASADSQGKVGGGIGVGRHF